MYQMSHQIPDLHFYPDLIKLVDSTGFFLFFLILTRLVLYTESSS